MQKGTIVKISTNLQCRIIAEGIPIKLENRFSPTGNTKTTESLKKSPEKSHSIELYEPKAFHENIYESEGGRYPLTK